MNRIALLHQDSDNSPTHPDFWEDYLEQFPGRSALALARRYYHMQCKAEAPRWRTATPAEYVAAENKCADLTIALEKAIFNVRAARMRVTETAHGDWIDKRREAYYFYCVQEMQRIQDQLSAAELALELVLHK